jgi:phosphoglycolate phosphatase-like HAD superfamily hydrolase
VGLVLPRTGLYGYFEAVVAGDEVTHPKPAPDGLELICRRLGVGTVETAYVGDIDVDLVCARNAKALGIQAVWSSDSVILAGNHLVANQPDEVIALIEASSTKVRK